MVFKSKVDYSFILFLALFLIASFIIIHDYGQHIDSFKNFTEGDMQLTYLLTGKAEDLSRWNQIHGSFSYMLAELSKRILYEKLHMLDPIVSRHIILPLLTSLFLVVLYFFVKKHFGALEGLTTTVTLVTIPSYFGHMFNNLKDIPLLIFFSLSIISFAEWRFTKRLIYLYGFFVFLGIALSIKIFALLILVILFFWLFFLPENFLYKSKKLNLNFICGILITIVIVLVFYMPLFWAVEDKVKFLQQLYFEMKLVTTTNDPTWDFIPLINILYRIPVILLGFSIFGLFKILINKKSPLDVLLILWLLIPVFIHILPHVGNYNNGLRLFIVFLVPLAILSVNGVNYISEKLSNNLDFNQNKLKIILIVLMIFFNLYGIISTHPYETTYFNSFASGLSGAQKKKLPQACDYWLNSYKEAEAWLDKNAIANAEVIYPFGALLDYYYLENIMRYALSRKDITVYSGFDYIKNGIADKNAYVVYVPLDYALHLEPILENPNVYKNVHEIKRQGGNILTIYQKI